MNSWDAPIHVRIVNRVKDLTCDIVDWASWHLPTIIVLSLLTLGGILTFRACAPKTETLVVEDAYWVSTVDIEEWRTVQEHGKSSMITNEKPKGRSRAPLF